MYNAKEINIVKYSPGFKEETTDLVVEEKPLNIFVNNEYYASLMCTSTEIEELCIGFLFFQGIIAQMSEIKNVEFSTEDIVFISLNKNIDLNNTDKKALVSGCGRGLVNVNMINNNGLQPLKYNHTFKADKIISFMKDFSLKSDLFLKTGGVHSCCICGDEGIEFFSEDIGRHNAVDKVIGKCLLNDIDRRSKMLLTTGRISSDIILKTAKAGIPVLISRSGPTNLAVDIAKNLNMTVAGFVRGARMNIYWGSERIIDFINTF